MVVDHPMSKLFSPGRLHTFLAAMVCLVAATSLGRAEDRFALAIGPHDVLAVFGPKGEKGPEITPNSLATPVTVSGISFQVSYGRDSAQRLTAIISPDAASPSDLHFNVLGKAIDADKSSVVTLTFSANARSVSIDPGMVGRVEVNSRRLPHNTSEYTPH
jgi:hypothetical protein